MNIKSPLRSLKRLNIRSRLLLLCLAVATPLLVISGFTILREYQALNNEAKQATTFQAAIASRTLAHWITGQEDALKALANLPAVRKLAPNDVYGILKTAVQAEKNWYGVALVTPDGKLIATDKPANKPCLSYLKTEPFFQKTLRSKKPVMSNYSYCPVTGKPSLQVAAPVIDQGKVKAVLIASVQPQAVLSLFSGLGQVKGSVIAVVDANHRVLARTLDNTHWVGKDFSNARTVRAAAKQFRGTLEAIGIADPVSRAYAFDHVPETMWLIVIGVPTQAIYGPAQEWLAMMLLLSGCGIGLSIVLAYAATGHFTGPIYALVREALAIGRGDLSKRVNVRSEDELGLLAQSFNQMAINLELNSEHNLMVERISESIRQSLDINEILNITVSELGKSLSANRCCLALIQSDKAVDETSASIKTIEFAYSWHDDKSKGIPLTNRSLVVTKNSILKRILEQGSVIALDVLEPQTLTPLFEGGAFDPIPYDWQAIKSLIACPITMHNKVLGLILVQQLDQVRTWIEPELKMVEAVARHVALAMDQAHLYGMTKQLAEQELLVNHIVKAVRSSLDLDTILTTVSRELGEAIEADRCQIALPRAEGPLYVSHEFHIEQLEPMKGLNIYSQKLDFHPVETYASGLRSLLGIDLTSLNIAEQDEMVVHETPLAVITNVAVDERAKPFTDFLALVQTKSLIAAPLLEDNRLLGVLIVHQCLNPRLWTASELSLVAAVADQVAVAISHARLFAQVKYQSITDGLTGLYNHVYLKNRLTEELRKAQRKDVPCSLLMLDLDWLKQINDNFGHPVGDNAIRQVAWTLKNLLRSGDTAARYGGEEFSVILPETPLSEAHLIAERLCRQVNNCFIPGLGKISVSVGCATYPIHADSPESLIDKADKALYLAKRSGRNQVAIWKDSDGEAHSQPQSPVSVLD